MKIIRLPAHMSLLEIDRRLAQQSFKLVRFIVGREAKKRDGVTIRPERAHALIVQPTG